MLALWIKVSIMLSFAPLIEVNRAYRMKFHVMLLLSHPKLKREQAICFARIHSKGSIARYT